MKTIFHILILFPIIGCSFNAAKYENDEKVIQIKCSIQEDTLNTFENVYSHQSLDGYLHRIPFFLSNEEQRRIIHIINNTEFFNLPDTLRNIDLTDDENERIYVRFTHLFSRFCDIELNGKRKFVYVSNTSNQRDEHLRFTSLMDTIITIVWRREEVKELLPVIWY